MLIVNDEIFENIHIQTFNVFSCKLTYFVIFDFIMILFVIFNEYKNKNLKIDIYQLMYIY